MFERRGKEIEF